jgi:hypothetical protein
MPRRKVRRGEVKHNLLTPPPLPDGAKPIPNAPGYAALPDGTIISCRGIEVHIVRWKQWQSLTPVRLRNKKYPYVTIKRNGQRKLSSVHRLVLLAFCGEPVAGQQGCHNDGNPLNAAANNLRWDTVQANHSDKIVHGTVANGERINTSKLSERDVVEIRRLYKTGISMSELGRRFGVYPNAIKCVVSRASWKHVT